MSTPTVKARVLLTIEFTCDRPWPTAETIDNVYATAKKEALEAMHHKLGGVVKVVGEPKVTAVLVEER